MIRHKVYMVVNDTGPPIDFDIYNDDAVYNTDDVLVTEATRFDLTGCVVRFTMRGPRNLITNTGHNVCVITNAEQGECRYNFAAGDIPYAGRFECDVEVTDGAGRVQTDYTITDIIVRSSRD